MGTYINGLVKKRRNSSALAMDLRLSCNNPSRWETKSPAKKSVVFVKVYILYQLNIVNHLIDLSSSKGIYFVPGNYLNIRALCYHHPVFVMWLPIPGKMVLLSKWGPGPRLNIKTIFSGMSIPMFKIRRSSDCLIFNKGIPILVKRHLYIEMASRFPFVRQYITWQLGLMDSYLIFKLNMLSTYWKTHRISWTTYDDTSVWHTHGLERLFPNNGSDSANIKSYQRIYKCIKKENYQVSTSQ